MAGAAENDFLVMFLVELAFHSPEMLAYLAGVVLALVSLRRHPKPATLALLGAGLMLLVALVNLFMDTFVLGGYVGQGPEESIGLVRAIGFAGSVLHALGFGLIMVAIFTARPRPLPSYRPDEVLPREPGSETRLNP